MMLEQDAHEAMVAYFVSMVCCGITSLMLAVGHGHGSARELSRLPETTAIRYIAEATNGNGVTLLVQDPTGKIWTFESNTSPTNKLISGKFYRRVGKEMVEWLPDPE